MSESEHHLIYKPETEGLGEVSVDRLLTAPNVITTVRLLFIPVFVYLLFVRESHGWAAIVLATLGATDWVDGYVARRFNQSSNFGAMYDPTVDRLLLVVAIVSILIDGAAPMWFALVILVREVVLSTFVVAITALGAKRMDVTWWGKVGTFLNMGAFPAFLLAREATFSETTRDVFLVLAYLAAVPGLIFSLMATVQYFWRGRGALAEGRADRSGPSTLSTDPPEPYGADVKAVIMAGGEGTRLRPLTSNAPKPMMPLANRPMMEHIIELLRRHDIEEIVVTVAFMANTIRNHFGDGSDFGVRMTYALEETPLGTAGSVRNAMEELDDTFLVISGDVLTDVDLSSIIAAHAERKAMATIGLVSVENPLEFGIVVCREDGSIERFLEKPTWGEVFTDTINSGIYVLEPEIFDFIPPDRPVDFSSEVFPALLDADKPLFGSVAQGYWEDVGTLDAYVAAHRDILDGAVDIAIDGFEMSKGIWVGEGADIHPSVALRGPAIIGENCSVAAGASVGEYVVLGQGVRLGADSTLDRAVVGENSYIGDSVSLRGAVVGRASDLRRGVRCEEGAVLGDEVFVGEDAVISGDVKVYPFKTVEARAVVNTSIIWESKGARSLFGRSGVSGLANVDITPEMAAKLAMAFATHLAKDSTVVISRDSSRTARMLKRAIMSGLNAGGVNVLDLEVASIPVTRFVCRWAQVSAGLSVRLDEGDPDGVTVRFFDESGSDLSSTGQRKIERIFSREDFRRRPGDIGDIDLPAHAVERYAVSLEHTLDIAAIAERRFKAVVDYSFGSVSFVMPNVLAKLRADVLALNPYASTEGVMNFDRDASARAVADLVVASKAQIGAVIDPGGERITLIDGQGRVLDPVVSLLAFLELIPDRIDGNKVALPVSAPRAAADVLRTAGLEPVWTKLGAESLIVMASEPDVGFAADLDGGFIVPGFMPAFDGAAALLKILDLLAKRDTSLATVVDGVPQVHLISEVVVTPWESKGLVMRSLMEQAKGREVDLVDGIKIHHDRGWVLLLPDPDEPVTHVIAEGDTAADAEQLIQEYSRRVRQLQR